MKKIMIATHARLASGFVSAIELLISCSKDIEVIDAYIDGTDITDRICRFISSIQPDDTGIIFTDLKCGSVNQRVLNLMPAEAKNIFVITGVNLPLILEVVLTDTVIDTDYLNEVIEMARKELALLELSALRREFQEDSFDFS